MTVSPASTRSAPQIGWQDVAAIASLIAICVAFVWRMALTDLILPRGDAFAYFYPYWAYRNEMLRAGHIPLWNPYLFMGAPFLANSQAGTLYPLNWPLMWLDAPTAVKVAAISHIAWAAVGAYLFGRRSLTLSVISATTAGALFALGGYFTAQVEHINQLQGLAWLPWLFWLWDEAASRRHVKASVWLGLAMAMQLLAGHTQSAFISGFGLGIYAIWHVARSLRWPLSKLRDVPQAPIRSPGGPAENAGAKRRAIRWKQIVWPLVPLVGGALMAVGLSAAQLLPTLELTSLSNRSGGLPFIEALSFSLRPNLIGRAFLPAYGTVGLFSEYVGYVGIIGLMLALYGVWAARRNPALSGLVVIAGTGLFLALGAYNPIYWGLVKIIPGFRLFRAPARWLVLWAFGVACLAGAGLDWISTSAQLAQQTVSLRATVRVNIRRLWPAGVVIALIGLAFLAPMSASEVAGASAPSGSELVIWSATALIALGLIEWAKRSARAVRHVAIISLATAAVIELFVASRTLPLNHLSAPAAWSSQRPAISTLLAAQQGQTTPARFLSISDIQFDPGDLREIRAMYQPFLDSNQIYDYVVAIKQKEILAPNLPLYWRIPAMDGFDGGVLPTRDYTRFTALFLDDKAVSPDGRLRENLKAVPDLTWLRMANVGWIVTDKVADAWVDGIYYDLQFPATRSGSGNGPQLTPIQAYSDQPFTATQVGIVGHLEGSKGLPAGAQVGSIAIFPAGVTNGQAAIVLPLIADDAVPGAFVSIDGAAPQIAGYFTTSDPKLADFRIVVGWRDPRRIEHFEISAVSSFAGELVIRGATLIDGRSQAFAPMTMSAGHALRLANSGDVKIYEDRGTLPRARLVCQVTIVGDEESMWKQLANNPPGSAPIIVDRASLTPESCDPADSGSATITSYEPERVAIRTAAQNASSYLVLSDAWFPGWEATIDGQAAEILHANGLFRAVRVPVGEHKVVFSYRSRGFELGVGISLAFAFLTFGALAIRWSGAAKPPTNRL